MLHYRIISQDIQIGYLFWNVLIVATEKKSGIKVNGAESLRREQIVS